MDLHQEVSALEVELLAKHGASQQERIRRGLRQVAAQWRPSDGNFSAFAREHFIADEATLALTVARLEAVLEQLEGHNTEISRALRAPTDLEIGPLLPVDPLLAAFDPAAHLNEDFFASMIGFVVLLNLPLTTLQERLDHGDLYSRDEWARVRLASRFSRRVPGEVLQQISRVSAEADLYVSEYNIWMHHLLDEKGERLFPKGMRLISHWNLRDELKANYADPRGLEKQRLIAKVMERIVTQTIPAIVVDNPRVDWEPHANRVSAAPETQIEEDAPARAVNPDSDPEPDVRYRKWIEQFLAARRVDPYTPVTPTALSRAFELGREMPEERVVGLLTEVVSSPVARGVAAEIEKRLGRPLEPHDLWFNGFQARGRYSEDELNAITRGRYPDAKAFHADMPRILQELGFSEEKARFLSEHIAVDAARGAGHAMEARRRGDLPRLRTRIARDGMDYKGYNVAIHEFGHNVEQVFSLYDVDRTLLAGVPNNAFTEAIAFVFQSRDLELLGLSRPDEEAERLRVLNTFWMTWEIAGVGLVDVAAWHWLYDHPQATPEGFREAVLAISKDVWNRYYAPVLGAKDSVLLGIYSHLIAYPLYLPDYPMGHLVAFQIEEHLRKSPAIGPEIERMTSYGAVPPDLWMKHATGAPVSAAPLLRATEAALASGQGR
ncbi:MAG TPA: hypothetical protein DFS52_14365 [Myxococcales bacterium]|nr:hypothetical protein [Myxococcales bacterium]